MSNTSASFEDVLKQMFSLYGADILKDTNRFNALLKDYAPTLEKERKLIIAALKEGIGLALFGVINASDSEQQRQCKICERELVENLYITEDAAHYVIFLISSALGISQVDRNNVADNPVVHTEVPVSELPLQADVSPENPTNSDFTQANFAPAMESNRLTPYGQRQDTLWAELAQKDYSAIDGSYFQIKLNTSKTIMGVFQIVSNVLYLIGLSLDSKGYVFCREQSLAIKFDSQGVATKFNNTPVIIHGLIPPNNVLNIEVNNNGEILVCGCLLVHDTNFVATAIKTAKKPLFSSRPFR